jgi:FAD/FMN-containing dehydrogenase
VGPLDEAEAVVAPLRATAAADGVGPMPYATFQSMLDYPEGLLHYWSAEYHDELSDQALDTFVTHGLSITSPLSMAALIRWGGAVARVEDSPLPRRSAGWVSHPFAVWDDPATNDVHIAWARGFADAMKPFGTGATYLNFVGDEREERVRAAYGAENYRRLAEIKAKYDPDNVFRLNHNITPAGSPA